MTLHEQKKSAFDKYKADQDVYLKLEEEALQRRRDALAESQSLADERARQNLEYRGKQQDLSRKQEGEELQRRQDADRVDTPARK
jgi:hypothetical protein